MVSLQYGKEMHRFQIMPNINTPKWTFLSNHAHILICLARKGDSRIRVLAVAVGITERTVQIIISDLEDGGYLTITKDGRRNRYTVVKSMPLRHAVESNRTVLDLLKLVL